jgi:serine/threonine protein kinase
MSLDDKDRVIAKLGDFGLAQAAAPHLSDFLGTWQWLSPEVLNAVNPKYDHRSDIFSFAIVFSEIMMRQLPYSNYSEFVLRQEHPLTGNFFVVLLHKVSNISF